MLRVVVLALLLTSADARAESPWVIAVGTGPALHGLTGRYTQESDIHIGASAQLEAGYRLGDKLALGMHLGFGVARVQQFDGSEVDGFRDETFVPFHGGVGAQIVIANRALIAPWAGYLDFDEIRLPATGIELGVDLVERGRDRIVAVATFTIAPRDHVYGYYSIGAGVAYRYW